MLILDDPHISEYFLVSSDNGTMMKPLLIYSLIKIALIGWTLTKKHSEREKLILLNIQPS